jgi:hypothetical protein
MKNIYIIKRLFKENKQLSISNRFYVINNYMKNIKLIKKENGLTLFQILFGGGKNNNSLKYLNKNEDKIFIENKNNENNFPNFEEELKEIKLKKQKVYMKKITTFFQQILKILNIKFLLDLKNSQNNIQKITEFASKHIGNYRKSIQELVEGQREVTTNKNFKFEDGETVQDKTNKFETKVKERLNINFNTIQEIYKNKKI